MTDRDTQRELGQATQRRFGSWSRQAVVGSLALVAVVLVAYFALFGMSFVGDDWIFYELAGRLSLSDYLIKYFDPRVQTAWYRPVQGVLFRIGYDVFQSEQVWYHLVNVFIHLANSLLLFALVARETGNWRGGFVAGLFFATFPIAVEGVFKAGVIDPVTLLFSLAAIWYWLLYLRNVRRRHYWLAFGSFLIALLSKEIAVTLPVILFLFDWLEPRHLTEWNQLARRYVWFVLVWIGYLPLEYVVVQRSVFVHREGYQPGLTLIPNLVNYAAGLAFPWKYSAPFSHVWLVICLAALGYLILAKRMLGLVPVIAGAILYVLPIIAFPEVSLRFAYASLAASALLFALLFERLWSFVHRSTVLATLLALAIVSLSVFGAAGVTAAAVDFGEFGRVSRVPFRNVRQAHPNLPKNALVYFIHPPLPGPNLSGMFFWYYGADVHVGVDDSQFKGLLGDYPVAYVEYFDDQGNQKEQLVDKDITTRVNPAVPARFSEPIQLEAYELASSRISRDQALLFFLYWRSLGPVGADYTAFAHLVDERGTIVASYDKEPRRGKSPTSSWTLEERVVDPVQLTLPRDVSPGTYKLEFGLYDAGTGKRVWLNDEPGGRATDRIIVEPIEVRE